MAYCPSPLVNTSLTTSAPRSTVTVLPGMTRFDGSVTLPRNAGAAGWAAAVVVAANNRSEKNTQIASTGLNLPYLNMGPSWASSVLGFINDTIAFFSTLPAPPWRGCLHKRTQSLQMY